MSIVKRNVLQVIEPVPEHRVQRLASRLQFLDRYFPAVTDQPLARPDGPDQRDSQQEQQRPDPAVVVDAALLEVEATGSPGDPVEGSEQRFHLPALGVNLDHAPYALTAHQDQKVVALQLHSRQVGPLPVNDSWLTKHLQPVLTEHFVCPAGLATIDHRGVGSNADDGHEPASPHLLANKLEGQPRPLSRQVNLLPRLDDRPPFEHLQKCQPGLLAAVALAVGSMPQQRDADAPVGDAKHQDLHRLAALDVVGAIQGQNHLIRLSVGRPDQLEVRSLAEAELAQQTLQALVLRAEQYVQADALAPFAERTVVELQQAHDQAANELHAAYVTIEVALNGIEYFFLFTLHRDSLGRVGFATASAVRSNLPLSGYPVSFCPVFRSLGSNCFTAKPPSTRLSSAKTTQCGCQMIPSLA